jgi:hypothetical protein
MAVCEMAVVHAIRRTLFCCAVRSVQAIRMELRLMKAYGDEAACIEAWQISVSSNTKSKLFASHRNFETVREWRSDDQDPLRRHNYE